MNPVRHMHVGRIVVAMVLCAVLLALSTAMPKPAYADDAAKTVRVGWFDSSFNTVDNLGRRSGYSYEYQMKISAYTGWKYEYVNGSWSDLFEMLKDGEIDLLSDVSYTPERDGQMLFTNLPMGAEEYYLFINPKNREIHADDYATINGKRVGVNKGSVQVGLFEEWSKRNGVQAQTVELSCPEDESLQMLAEGKIDAYITPNAFTEEDENPLPVWKIGSSDFFFAVSNDRPDLLDELNRALESIQQENRYYNEQMFEKYINTIGANSVLTPKEEEWLRSHGAIRVGYQDNYLAFCAKDPATGELTGAMRDYLDYAADCLSNAHIDFTATAYPSAAAAFAAMEAGDVDCVFPSNLNSFEGESMDAIITAPLMKTDTYAVVRMADQMAFAKKGHVIVAIDENNPNYDAFLQDNFPNWRRVYYPVTEDCLKAVKDGVADCVLISNYRYNNISRVCDSYHLVTLNTGVGIDYSFAMNDGEKELYSILSKVVSVVPESTANAALSHYVAEDAKLTFSDFLIENLPLIIGVICLVMLVILSLLVRSMRAEKTARNLISATEIDALTSLYNRDFFFQYANGMYREQPDIPKVAIVMNIERFHSVNALNGRDFGDQVLRTLGFEVGEIAKNREGIGGRFGADRFDIYCRQPEPDEYQVIFDHLQAKLYEFMPNANVRLRMGVMPWQEDLEPVQQFDRARVACSMARGHFKEHLIVFDESLAQLEIYEQRLMNDLHRALDSFEFEVYYQPKINIQAEPPRIVSAEALVRWRHPELGVISPGDFIPLFERNGQITSLDRYVWDAVAKQVVRWRELYGVTMPVSVNLSRVDIFDPTLEETLEKIVKDRGLGHEALKLEVTESAYTENADQVIQVVESLRARGYEVEMDDFGTGYSSLNMLSEMPIDVLKMDRGFVRNIEYDEKDKQLVGLIIDIAKSLKIPVVAEGVETEEQVRLLKELGCEIIQGYYFSEPLHVSVFEDTYVRPLQEHDGAGNASTDE